jgi:hypothetical protein
MTMFIRNFGWAPVAPRAVVRSKAQAVGSRRECRVRKAELDSVCEEAGTD